jgi:hypothetical protein
MELTLNPLTPNDHYSGRTALLTSERCILCIYSTNIGTEYFKNGTYSPFSPLQNAVCFIFLTYLILVLFTVFIQGVIKLKKIFPTPKGLMAKPNQAKSAKSGGDPRKSTSPCLLAIPLDSITDTLTLTGDMLTLTI